MSEVTWGVLPFYPGALYFLIFMALGSISPFVSIILEEKGLGEFQIGVVLACRPLCTFFAAPLGGYLFDRSGQSKFFWCGLVLCASFFMQLIWWWNDFYALVVAICLVTTVAAPVGVLADHSVLVFLGENKENYGYHRLWGAVSWGVVSMIMGVVLTYYPYSWAFVTYFCGQISVILLILLTRFTLLPSSKTSENEPSPSHDLEDTLDSVTDAVTLLHDTQDTIDPFPLRAPEVDELEEPENENAEEGETPDSSSPPDEGNGENQLVVILRALQSPKVLVFYLTAYIMGIGTYLIGAFLFLFLQDLGGSETLMGLSLAFTVMTEIPFFFYSNKILLWCGEEWLIAAAMVGYVVRVLGYSVLEHPWRVLPLELLHGLTFGAMKAAGVHFSSKLLPPALSATAQGLFSGVYSGVGPLTGSILGGWMYESLGPRRMFQVMAVIVSFGMLLLFITFWREMTLRCQTIVRTVRGRWRTYRMVPLDGAELDNTLEWEEDS